MTSSPPPYPADTRAKGWRFELDYEQIEQSSTWALAGPEARPWLLMLWLSAWRQVPCGSLPCDHAVIAAQIGMPPKSWAKHSTVLMRGWYAADDGRLYHDTLTQRVIEMMKRRRSDSDRKAAERMRKAADSPVIPPGVTPVSRVTPPGVTRESSTDNRQPNTDMAERATPGRAPVAHPVPEIEDPEGFDPTPGGRIVQALRRRAKFLTGLPGDARLLALLEQGATEDEFVGVGTEATSRGKSWAWLLTAVENRRSDAARIVLKPPPGITTASDAAERTLQLIRGQQLSPEEYAASLEAKRRVLGKSRKKSA